MLEKDIKNLELYLIQLKNYCENIAKKLKTSISIILLMKRTKASVLRCKILKKKAKLILSINNLL